MQTSSPLRITCGQPGRLHYSGEPGIAALRSGAELVPARRDRFEAAFDHVQLDSDVCVDRLVIGPVERLELRGRPDDEQHGIGILLPVEGRFDVAEPFGNVQLQIGAGEGVVVDRTVPWIYSSPGDLRMVRAALPTSRFSSDLLRSLQGRALRLLPSPVLVAYAALLRAVFVSGLSDGATTRRIGRIVEQLSLEVVDEAIGSRERSRAEQWRHTISGYVDQHLREANLGVESIAGQFGISRRYIHRIFAGGEQTLGRMIEQRRLGLVATILSESPSAPLGELATRSGFRSAEQLSRAFRRRFGLSITDFRRDRTRYRL